MQDLMEGFIKPRGQPLSSCLSCVIRLCVFAILAIVLAGCASTKPVVLDPIGPAPHAASGVGTQGSLVVFSAFDPTADLNRTPYRRRYTDYQILAADGKQLVQVVNNNRETLLNNPPAVELAAGSYRV